MPSFFMMNARRVCRPGPALVFALAAAVAWGEGAKPTHSGGVDTALAIETIHGQSARPFECAGEAARAAVVIFITTDCPVANRYAPEIEKLRAEFAGRGVKLTLAHVDPDLPDQKAREHAAQFALKGAVVVDRKHRLVQASGATVTPEAVVVDAAGRIRYRGRIDDRFTDFGKSRRTASRHDLRDAIQAVLEGRPVTNPETKVVGCLIPAPSRSPQAGKN